MTSAETISAPSDRNGVAAVSPEPLDDPGLTTAIDATARALLDEAVRIEAQFVEFRSQTELDLPVKPLETKVNLVRSLPPDAARLWAQLDPKVRNQIRKAERLGLSVEFGHEPALDSFYDVFAANMRDLGSPVHGRVFFRTILQAFGDRARIALVRKGSTIIGGLLALSPGGGARAAAGGGCAGGTVCWWGAMEGRIRVEDGAEVLVTRRGRPIARLSAVEESDPLRDLVRRGLVTPPDRPRTARRARVKARELVSELVAEQRR